MAGEIAGAERAGRAVGVASTVVFGCTSALTPVAGLVAETFGYDAMWLLGAASSATGAAIAATLLTRAVGTRRSILVEAAARLTAQPPRLDVAAQQRARAVFRRPAPRAAPP